MTNLANIEPLCNVNKAPLISCNGDTISVFGLSKFVIESLIRERRVVSLSHSCNCISIKWWDFLNLKEELSRLGINEADLDDDAFDYMKRLNGYINCLSKLYDVNNEVEVLESSLFNKQYSLFDIQKRGVLALLRSHVFNLWDEMGVGKTVQTIYAYALLREYSSLKKMLIICPKSVKFEWKHSLKRFINVDAVVVDNVESFNNNSDIFIVNYEQLISRNRRESAIYKKLNSTNIDVIVIDEAHYIKNLKSKRTRACVSLIRNQGVKDMKRFKIGRMDGEDLLCSKFYPFVWLLTGTPMDKATDAYVPLFLSLSGFPSWGVFLEFFSDFKDIRKGGRVIRVPSGFANESQLKNISFMVSIRRTRDQIRHIDFIERKVDFEFDREQYLIFRDIIRNTDVPILERIIKAIKFTNNPKLLNLDFPSYKYDFVIDLLQSTNEKIVIWTVFKDAVDLLKSEINNSFPDIKVCTFYGDDDVEITMKKFVEEGYQVLISTFAKGSFGVNFMKEADIVIYLEKPFSYIQFVQSRDRVLRVDRVNKKPVLFMYLHTHAESFNNESIIKTTDDLLEEIINTKRDLNSVILSGDFDISNLEVSNVGC